MELKVWVEGIQRIVCGVTEKTTCQDVVYALAHATGKTGRFTLIERWRNNERLLAPQEHPLKVLQKWAEYSNDVQFILQRSALEGAKPSTSNTQHPPPPAAVWKPPPPPQQQQQQQQQQQAMYPARISPDSGRGSDRTVGSDSSNGFSDKETSTRPTGRTSQPPPPPANGYSANYTRPSSSNFHQPPAYRPPPPHNGYSSSSPDFPPPYRNPPPPPAPPISQSFRYMGAPTSTHTVRPPRYSPPPTHRTPHLSRHPSRNSLALSSSNTHSMTSHQQHQQAVSKMNQHGLPSRQHAVVPSSRVKGSGTRKQGPPPLPPSDLAELVSLVSAQQSTLMSQQAEIKQCDAEASYLDAQLAASLSNGASNGSTPSVSVPCTQHSAMMNGYGNNQIELVLSEVRRLEEIAHRNDEELGALGVLEASLSSSSGSNSKEDLLIKNEISHLKQRLAGTDQELQRTNNTLRLLGDEMRSMSLEKSRQRELELKSEIERLQGEIKLMQKNSEESANLSQQLSKEVREVEDQIAQRKGEVEKLIKEMRNANMESLAISPPEESKQFLEGPNKPGTSRKMLGSPRALENAVPSAKNPHGVWV